jgi:MarR family transcriptional regulator, organic hydroperoxide resistance regulator
MSDYIERYGPAAIGARLRRLSEMLDNDAGRIYSALGEKFEQRWVGVIEHLATHGTASVGEIAAALGISHPSVSQARTSLQARGLIRSKPDPQDARSRKLSLSPAGNELFARLNPLWLILDRVAIELNEEAGDAFAALTRLDAALARKSLYDRISDRLPAAVPRKARSTVEKKGVRKR